MTVGPMVESKLPLPLLRKGKVREVYDVDAETVLLVASDRISAFDVVMNEPIPHKGAVLTQMSAYWFRTLASITPSHYITADSREICQAVPALADHEALLAGRAMLAKRTTPVAFECVVRGYLSGSAWKEYSASGTLAGEPGGRRSDGARSRQRPTRSIGGTRFVCRGRPGGARGRAGSSRLCWTVPRAGG